jgi:hypothetical protein
MVGVKLEFVNQLGDAAASANEHVQIRANTQSRVTRMSSRHAYVVAPRACRLLAKDEYETMAQLSLEIAEARQRAQTFTWCPV